MEDVNIKGRIIGGSIDVLSDLFGTRFDKTKEFKLCYVPSEYKKNLQDCVTEFRKKGISCGIDAAAKYPWILPVILLLLSFAFVFYAKNKILYAICAIFPNLCLFFQESLKCISLICL